MEHEGEGDTSFNWYVALRNVLKGMKERLEEFAISGRIGTMQTSALWRLARIL